MDLSTFEDCLDLHGGDMARWPLPERDAALALLAGSAEARAARDAMAEIETVLRREPPASATLSSDGMAARASRQRQETPARRLALRVGWAAVAALVLAVGLAIGAHAPVEHDDSPGRVMAMALSDGGSADVE